MEPVARGMRWLLAALVVASVLVTVAADARRPRASRRSIGGAPAAAWPASPYVLPAGFTEVPLIAAEGQSFQEGNGGSPPLSTTVAFANRESDGGALIDLVNATVERPFVDAINTLGTLDTAFRGMLGAHCAVGGQDYATIRLPGGCYDIVQDEVTYAAANAGDTVICAGLDVIHGGTDADTGTTYSAYRAAMLEWATDFATDCIVTTGQLYVPPALHTQRSEWSAFPTEFAEGVVLAQLDEALAGRGSYLSGPRYPYQRTGDGIHLTPEAYELLGDHKGYVWSKLLGRQPSGQPWPEWPNGLRPIETTAAGSTVTLRYVVPCLLYGECGAQALVFDSDEPSPTITAITNRGFRLIDPNPEPGQPSLTSVALGTCGARTCDVVLTFDGPVRTGSSIGACDWNPSGTSYADAGPVTGPRCDLRDTNTVLGHGGRALYNYAVVSRTAASGGTAPADVAYANIATYDNGPGDEISADYPELRLTDELTVCAALRFAPDGGGNWRQLTGIMGRIDFVENAIWIGQGFQVGGDATLGNLAVNYTDDLGGFGPDLVTSSDDWVSNTWYWVCVDYDGSAATPIERGGIYRNGVELPVVMANGDLPTALNTSSTPWYFGGDGTTGTMDGRMDHVLIFERRLTAQEHTDLYEALTTGGTVGEVATGISGLLLWWSFDLDTLTGSSGDVLDHSGNGHHGTSAGGALSTSGLPF